MKTLKISEAAHQKLKVFAATMKYNMSGVASEAIVKYLKEYGKQPQNKKP